MTFYFRKGLIVILKIRTFNFALLFSPPPDHGLGQIVDDKTLATSITGVITTEGS
jgi:hypothetical protein